MEIRPIPLDDDAAWQQVRKNVPQGDLLHRDDFRQHWFAADQNWSQLWGAFDANDLAGLLAVENVEFVAGDSVFSLAVGTNFYSFRPGAGILLYQRWIEHTGWTLTFGGSSDFHRFIERIPNVFRVDIPHFVLNRHFTTSSDVGIRRLIKRAVNRTRIGHVNGPRRIAASLESVDWGSATVAEVTMFRSLIPWSEPFDGLRQNANLDYLNWRYGNGALPYRKFEVHRDAEHVANVALAESSRRMLVAFSQSTTGVNATQSALAVVKHALSRSRADSKKEVYLACCNSVLRGPLERAGFRETSYRRPFVVLGSNAQINLPTNLDQWHVDFDIGDNGIRYLQGD